MKLTLEFETVEELKELLGKLTKDFDVENSSRSEEEDRFPNKSDVELFLAAVDTFRRKGWAIATVSPDALGGVDPKLIENKLLYTASEVIYSTKLAKDYYEDKGVSR